MAQANAARVQDAREEQAVRTLKEGMKKPKGKVGRPKKEKAKKPAGKKSFRKAPNADHIRQFLKDNPEYTHEKLAGEMGVHGTSISNWLSGNYEVPYWTLGNIENLRRTMKNKESRKDTFIVQTNGGDQTKTFQMIMDQLGIKTKAIAL